MGAVFANAPIRPTGSQIQVLLIYFDVPVAMYSTRRRWLRRDREHETRSPDIEGAAPDRRAPYCLLSGTNRARDARPPEAGDRTDPPMAIGEPRQFQYSFWRLRSRPRASSNSSPRSWRSFGVARSKTSGDTSEICGSNG